MIYILSCRIPGPEIAWCWCSSDLASPCVHCAGNVDDKNMTQELISQCVSCWVIIVVQS